jgi:hypothetical protein
MHGKLNEALGYFRLIPDRRETKAIVYAEEMKKGSVFQL